MCYKSFSDSEASEWGKENFGNWLINMQDQKLNPITPVEQFFRFYTQGIHYVYNRILRSETDIDKNCKSSVASQASILLAIKEIQKHPCTNDIIVYRYIDKSLLNEMKKWCNIHFVKKNQIIFDKAFLSTTFTPEVVLDRGYAQNYKKILKIYVPKGTPCVYVDLISDMHENEVIFCPNTKLQVISASILSKCIECIVVNN